MKLAGCPACGRHVDVESARCPFCSIDLGLAPASANLPWAIVAIGLALAGCGGDDSGPSSTSIGDATSSTSGPTGSVTINDTFDTSGNEYAGPGFTFTLGPADSGSSETSDTGSGSSETSGTGSDSAESTSDSGGQDYAGAAPPPEELK